MDMNTLQEKLQDIRNILGEISVSYVDDKLKARQEWLKDHSVEEKDLMADDNGEYIIVDSDFSPEFHDNKKVYLPEYLRV